MAVVYGKKKSTSTSTTAVGLADAQTKSVTFWVMAVITVLFLIWAPFQRGLFDGYSSDWDRPLYSAFMWSSILLVVAAVFFFFYWKYQYQRDTATVLIWLLPFSYLLSLSQAASHYYATTLLYLHIMYAAFFVIVAYLAQTKLGNRILEISLMATGYLLVIYGMFNWFGNTHTPGMTKFLNVFTSPLSRNDAVMVDSNGYRLTSVFQYANTYAGYLIALFLGALFLTVRGKKAYVSFIHAFMLVPILVSFFLTLSRGALVVIPVIMLVLLLFLPVYRQILMLIYAGIAGIATLAILSKVTSLGEELQKLFVGSHSLKGWMILLAASIVSAAATAIIQQFAAPWLERKLSGFNGRRFATVTIPVIAVVVGAIGAFLLFSDTGFTKVLPDNVRTRIETINLQQHSVLERGTFYKDAMKLFKDYPVLGGGGGSWAALYEKYQNNPYTSRQAHNFLLQYLDEIGTVGCLFLLLIIGYVFFIYVRHYMKQDAEKREAHFLYAIIALSLLVHSVLDFNMSYGYFAAIVFIALGGMSASAVQHEAFLAGRLQKLQSILRRGYPAAIAVLGIVFFIISAQLLRGNTLFKQAQDEAQSGKGNYQSIMNKLNGALSAQKHPEYYQLKIALQDSAYNQQKQEQFYKDAVATIAEFKKQEPNQRNVMVDEYQHDLMKENYTGALQVLESDLPRYNWDITLYELVISLYAQLGDDARTAKNISDMDSKWNKAFEYYNEILEKMKYLETLPKGQIQGREFDVTNLIALSLGQIDFMRGDYQAALAMLRNKLTDDFSNTPDDPQLRTTRISQATWYLATLKKLNQDDPNLSTKLFAADPSQKDQINTIVGTNFSVK